MLKRCIHRHSLYAVSTSDSVSGPGYTFFSSNSFSTLDYILTDSSLVGQGSSCGVHQHHPLNLSDHLPVSIVIAFKTSTLPPLPVPTKSINWTRAIENRDIDYFAAEVSSVIWPFIDTSHQGIQELEWEIT